MHVGIALDLGPAEQVLGDAAGQLEARRVQPARCHRAEIDQLGPGFAGPVDDGETDAAQPGVSWLDRGQRQGGG
ncbi:hypothetical protein ABTM63_20045, partial [Acinetobacter baumannii]